MDRGIKYIALNLKQAKLFIFINSSFANNKDFSSQIGYLIIFANKTKGINKFAIKGNLIYYSSTKNKRVIRSVLASKIYIMVKGVNIAITINTTIKIITRQLGFSYTLIIICTNLYLLYKCLVKFNTTKEKCSIINIIILCQLYKHREITEI